MTSNKSHRLEMLNYNCIIVFFLMSFLSNNTHASEEILRPQLEHIPPLIFNAQIGSVSLPQAIMLTNVGNAPFEIEDILTSQAIGQEAAFTVVDHDCGSTIEPDKSCTLNVVFAPLSQYINTAYETHSGVIRIQGSQGDDYDIYLSGLAYPKRKAADLDISVDSIQSINDNISLYKLVIKNNSRNTAKGIILTMRGHPDALAEIPQDWKRIIHDSGSQGFRHFRITTFYFRNAKSPKIQPIKTLLNIPRKSEIKILLYVNNPALLQEQPLELYLTSHTTDPDPSNNYITLLTDSWLR